MERAAARRAFNASVMEYNNMVIQFPSSIIAGMFNFTFRESFTVSEEEAKPVNVGNLFKQ
ncbi:MAG: LemA family protein [Deltaproteobacteria bacterium]|nr:LemA family protein [Deltaproteobacteria bacterium]